MTTKATRREAAGVLRHVVKLLPMSPTMRAYLVGHADSLDPDERPKPRQRTTRG